MSWGCLHSRKFNVLQRVNPEKYYLILLKATCVEAMFFTAGLRRVNLNSGEWCGCYRGDGWKRRVREGRRGRLNFAEGAVTIEAMFFTAGYAARPLKGRTAGLRRENLNSGERAIPEQSVILYTDGPFWYDTRARSRGIL